VHIPKNEVFKRENLHSVKIFSFEIAV